MFKQVLGQRKRSLSAVSSIGRNAKVKYDTPFRLVILDLNGTVVYRAKNKSGRSIANGNITPRPYLGAFLHYCLGDRYTIKDAKGLYESWPSKERELVPHHLAPHGSDFWLRKDRKLMFPPKSRVNLVVWSSATKENVHRMVNCMLEGHSKALLERVWARETLVPSFLTHKKVATTKDLHLVWNELNAWEEHLATRQSVDQRTRVSTFIDANKRGTDQRSSRNDNAAYSQAELKYDSPWGPNNTLILDDSRFKARLNPNNHICIPEYTREKQKLYSTYLEQKAWIEGRKRMNGTDTKEGVIDASELDDALLQVVGVLDETSMIEDISAWIRDGGLGDIFTERSQWAAKGRDALLRLNIPIEP